MPQPAFVILAAMMRLPACLRLLAVLACALALPAAHGDEEQLTDLLREYREEATGLRLWPELKPSAGTAFRSDAAVYIQLGEWPREGRLVIPRLNNPTAAAHLLGQRDTEVKLSPEPREWLLTLPAAEPDTPKVVVLPTTGPPQLPPERDTIKAGSHGAFVLPAHRAVTHGERLRYEPQPHKNTLGYWTEPKDWAQWFIQADGAGEFELWILQGCGQGQGGSEVAIHVRSLDPATRNESVVHFQVEDTGHFQNFVSRKLGAISLPRAGVYAVEIRPLRMAAKAVMDVREVRLLPKP